MQRDVIFSFFVFATRSNLSNPFPASSDSLKIVSLLAFDLTGIKHPGVDASISLWDPEEVDDALSESMRK